MFIKSYKSVFILLFTVLLGLTVTSITYTGYSRATKATYELSGQVVQEVSYKVIQHANNIFHATLGYLEVNATVAVDEDPLAIHPKLWWLFWQQIHQTPQITSIYLADTQGNFVQVVGTPRMATRLIDRTGTVPIEQWIYRDDMYNPMAHLNKGAEVNPTEYSWFQKTLKGAKPYWSDVYYFKNTHDLGITISYPVINKAGEVRAVVAADISLADLSDFLSEQKHGSRGVALIIDKSDHVIAYPHQLRGKPATQTDDSSNNRLLTLAELEKDWLNDAYQAYQTAHKQEEHFFSETNGEVYISAMTTFPKGVGQDWRLFMVVPKSDILRSASRIVQESIIISTIILLISIIIIYFVLVQLLNPFHQIVRNMELVKQFRFGEVVLHESRFIEMQMANKSFYEMRKALEIFEKYIPYNLVNQLVKGGQKAEISGKVAEITIFVLSIERFDSLVKEMSANTVLSMLSRRLDKISHLIHQNQGIIDKHLGNTVSAFWGAPIEVADSAYQVCDVALTCLQTCQNVNIEERRKGVPILESFITVNTGTSLVGNISSDSHLKYKAIGNDVDFCMFLHRVNEYVYQVPILITQSTYEKVGEDFICRFLDVVKISAEARPIQIYELLCKKGQTLSRNDEQYKIDYETAFSHYLAQEWEEAIPLFEQLVKKNPDDNPAHILLNRCCEFKKAEILQPDWDGAVLITNL